MDFPDPEGKIHVVIRKYNDETASRNHEMLSIMSDGSKGIHPHATSFKNVKKFFEPPDYFLIADPDEIYDVETFPVITEYVAKKNPKAMRVSAYEYGVNWNRRVPEDVYMHHVFGFVKAGVIFEERRVITWNEHRLRKLLLFLKLNLSFANNILGYINCPKEVGIFHHGAYLRRTKEKMIEKMNKHSHPANHDPEYLERILNQKYDYIPTASLPANIRNGKWPSEFWSDDIYINKSK